MATQHVSPGQSAGRNTSQRSDIVVLGSGFSGLWAALGAARRLSELEAGPGAVEVTVISCAAG